MTQTLPSAARKPAHPPVAKAPVVEDRPTVVTEEPADPLDEMAETIDRVVRSSLAHVTGGLAPTAIASSFADWAVHLAWAPGKRAQLLGKTMRKWSRFGQYAWTQALAGEKGDCCIEPLPQDKRFSAPAWQKWPFNLIQQSFLLQQQWWHNATTGVPGVSRHHEDIVAFAVRQMLDTMSPSNFAATNPVVLDRAVKTGGTNFIRGGMNFLEDWQRLARGAKGDGEDAFVPGRDVAITPGKVVFRNHLIELIQYAPRTETVRPEPILIVPAWIMKYYILDLSPQNSLVRFLTERGFTVFMISWRNPTAEDRDLGIDDYRALGIGTALDAVNAIVPQRKVHAVGYCLGGTLLTIEAAAMARAGDDRLKSVTLFAAQADFEEAGELTLFISESQVRYLEDLMWSQGTLHADQMAGAFTLLRSNDLIWSRIIQNYLMGEREQMNDLMAWNADATRMPARMHSDYLRRLFLANDLAEGRFTVAGRPIVLSDIRAPIFAVGTERDHVAPWRSVFKIHLLTDTDVTFLLASGGHNVGIVAAPGNDKARYRVLSRRMNDRYLDPDTWLSDAESRQGSWWPEWVRWLERRSSSDRVPPPEMGKATAGYAPVCDAPGSYVLQH